MEAALRSTRGLLDRFRDGPVGIRQRSIERDQPHVLRAFVPVPVRSGRRRDLNASRADTGRRPPADAADRALTVFPALKPRLSETGRLSGGQQQMLALARAYITQPYEGLPSELDEQAALRGYLGLD